MEKFIEFLTYNWDKILVCLVFILELVAILIKRRPRTVSEFYAIVSEALNVVPDLVAKVEQPGHGLEKSNAVISAITGTVSKVLKRDLDEKEISYIAEVTQRQIEKVLSSPKKGVQNEI